MTQRTFWQRFSAGYWAVLHRIATVMSAILLTILFFTVLAATAILMRVLLRRDLLHLRSKESYWFSRRRSKGESIDRYTHQY